MGKTGKIRHLDTNKPFEGDFENIYSEYFRPLYLYARTFAKSDDIAKDIVSEVFFNLWKSKTNLGQINQLEAYLFRSVKNQAIRTLSHETQNLDSLSPEHYVKLTERISPEEVLVEKELVAIIEKAVHHLPDQCRLIFDMAKNKQMSYREIADELGVSHSTIKTQVARALAVIKQTIEKQYESKRERIYSRYGLNSLILIATAILGQPMLLPYFYF